MTEAPEIRHGYEQYLPPQPPPGMYFDQESGHFLPQGVRLASRGRVAAAWFLGLSLFIVTLGIGYIVWSLFEWGQGRSPAQRILGLRCWRPELRRVAGRGRLALRQITGFCLNTQALAGVFICLISNDMRSVGDFFAHTVILYDPDGILPLSLGEDVRKESAHVGERSRVGERVVGDPGDCSGRVKGAVTGQQPGPHQAGLRRPRGGRGQAAVDADRAGQRFARPGQREDDHAAEAEPDRRDRPAGPRAARQSR
jgi:hypothetical protein